MRTLHWKQRLKYLNAVAEHLISLGYHVEQPKHDDDFLDVWGTIKGSRCYYEIYVTMYPCGDGINGIWDFSEMDEGTEMYLSNDPLYGLDTRWCVSCYFPKNFKPFKRGRLKAS